MAASLIHRAVKNISATLRAAEFGSSAIPTNSQLGSPFMAPGMGGGEAGALAIGTVLACVKALYDDTTVLPFRGYEGDPDGARRPLKVQPQIVSEPFGPDLSPAAGFGQLVVSKAMRGNCYAYVVARDRDLNVTQLLVLHPDKVTVKRTSTGKVFKIEQKEYSTEEIVHIPGFMLPGAAEGVDVLSYQRTTFDLAWSVNTDAAGFFDGGGSPAGVISVPGAGDRRRAREVKEVWEASHSGVVNAHRPAILFGNATWTPMSVTPENAQFLETRRFLREEICGLYGVPLQRIQAIVENASQGGGKGLDAIDAGYVKHGILPAIRPIEEEWGRLIAGGPTTFARFNTKEFLRASEEIRAQVAQIHRVTAVRTPDEIRAEEGWEPLPDGKGSDPNTPLNSNASPTGGASNAPAPTNIPAPGGQQ